MLRLLILPLSTILLFDFGTVPTVWYFLELFRQCGIFWNCSDSVVFFGTVPTVWYFLELFRQCGIFWNCSDSVVFFAFHLISYEKGHKHCIRPSLYFCVSGTS